MPELLEQSWMLKPLGFLHQGTDLHAPVATASAKLEHWRSDRRLNMPEGFTLCKLRRHLATTSPFCSRLATSQRLEDNFPSQWGYLVTCVCACRLSCSVVSSDSLLHVDYSLLQGSISMCVHWVPETGVWSGIFHFTLLGVLQPLRISPCHLYLPFSSWFFYFNLPVSIWVSQHQCKKKCGKFMWSPLWADNCNIFRCNSTWILFELRLLLIVGWTGSGLMANSCGRVVKQGEPGIYWTSAHHAHTFPLLAAITPWGFRRLFLLFYHVVNPREWGNSSVRRVRARRIGPRSSAASWLSSCLAPVLNSSGLKEIESSTCSSVTLFRNAWGTAQENDRGSRCIIPASL